MTSKNGQQWAEISTWVKANFSVSLCEMEPSSKCKQIEGNKSQTLSVVRRHLQNYQHVEFVITSSEQLYMIWCHTDVFFMILFLGTLPFILVNHALRLLLKAIPLSK